MPRPVKQMVPNLISFMLANFLEHLHLCTPAGAKLYNLKSQSTQMHVIQSLVHEIVGESWRGSHFMNLQILKFLLYEIVILSILQCKQFPRSTENN